MLNKKSAILIIGLIFLKIPTECGQLRYDHPNLVALWRLNEGTGTAAGDTAVNPITGTIANGAWVDGKYSKAIYFNGVNAKITMTANAKVDAVDNVTYMCWVKIKIPSDYKIVISRNATGAVNMLYYMGVFYAQVNAGGFIGASTDIRPIMGKWYHFAVTYIKSGADGKNLKAYIDGKLKGSANPTDNLILGSYITIGTNWDNNYIDAIIDEIAVFNRALSAGEIKKIYDSTKSSFILR